MNERMKNKKTKIVVFFGAVAVMLLLLLIIFLLYPKKDDTLSDYPTLIIETPPRIGLSETKEVLIDVRLSSLGDFVYPAFSASIDFDPSHLEFISIEEGNVFIRNEEGDVGQKLPQWSYNAEQCNKTGKINLMYLDTTGGKNAFTKELLAEEYNVVFRIKFRLRGSAQRGDVYDLIVEDAVFAASDESNSLAMTRDTLKVRNGKIVIGE